MAKTVLGEPGSWGPQGGLIRMYIEVRTGGPKEESLFPKNPFTLHCITKMSTQPRDMSYLSEENGENL